MTTRLVDTATPESTSWAFLSDPHDEYEARRRAMVEEIWNSPEDYICHEDCGECAAGECLAGEWRPLDWGVNPDTVAQIRRRTDRIAAKYEVPAEDLYEDTILHMAVRPERVTEASVNDLAWYANGVATNLAKPVVNRRVREESLEALLSAPARDLE